MKDKNHPLTTLSTTCNCLTMSKVSTELKDLKVGDLIYAQIIVNIDDVADPKSKSTTTRL